MNPDGKRRTSFIKVKTNNNDVTATIEQADLALAVARRRTVTRGRDDIFPILQYLTKRLFPFNYVVPGQSINSVLGSANTQCTRFYWFNRQQGLPRRYCEGDRLRCLRGVSRHLSPEM